jgi:hypothetical protein
MHLVPPIIARSLNHPRTIERRTLIKKPVIMNFLALPLLFHCLGDQWNIVTPNTLALFAQTVRVSEAFTPE